MLKHTPLHAVTHSATTQVQVGLQRLFELLIVNYFSISQAAERLTEQLWLIGPAALRPLMLIYFPDIHKVKSAEKKGPRQLSADLCCVFMWGFISISKKYLFNKRCHGSSELHQGCFLCDRGGKLSQSRRVRRVGSESFECWWCNKQQNTLFILHEVQNFSCSLFCFFWWTVCEKFNKVASCDRLNNFFKIRFCRIFSYFHCSTKKKQINVWL